MEKIQIIHVGQADPDVDVKKIGHIAEKAQSHYNFFIGDPLTTLGKPMDSGVYLPEDLLKNLIAKRHVNDVSVTVGITHVLLHEDIMSTVDRNNKAVLITTHPTTTEPFLSRVKAKFASLFFAMYVDAFIFNLR